MCHDLLIDKPPFPSLSQMIHKAGIAVRIECAGLEYRRAHQGERPVGYHTIPHPRRECIVGLMRVFIPLQGLPYVFG